MNIIGIAYNTPLEQGAENWESSQDVLDQVEELERAARELGHRPTRIPFTGDLQHFLTDISAKKPDIVFNLCESVNEDPRLISHPAAVLELLGIPFTGSPSMALMLSTDKVISKQLLGANGIRTPDFLVIEDLEELPPIKLKFPVIIKPRYQDASIGIDQESICHSRKELVSRIEIMFRQYGSLLVEEYIAGREFNIALLGYPTPTVLPLAEIDFSSLPEGLHPIVGYKAKWHRDSPEYQSTRRVFPEGLPLFFTFNIKRLSKECFRIFQLRDYGRVDIRVDVRGRVFVLEVNANPCLSSDAGFTAAANKSGLTYVKLIEKILKYSKMRKKDDTHTAASQGR